MFTDRMMQIIALITILVDRALDPDHDDLLCAHRRRAVAAAHRARACSRSPPNSVLVSLAMFLTLFVMAPYASTTPTTRAS